MVSSLYARLVCLVAVDSYDKGYRTLHNVVQPGPCRRATTRVAACDVADAAEASPLLAFAAPTGVLRAAAVRVVMCTPLQAFVMRKQLRAFGLFSMVASACGNVSQANYAAGSDAYLDAHLAHSVRMWTSMVS